MSRDEYIHTVNSCYDCPSYDPDEGCSMPGLDREYACRLHSEGFKIKNFYYNNPDFTAYVDKYCRDYSLTIDEALSHELVRQVYLHYKEEGDNGISMLL